MEGDISSRSSRIWIPTEVGQASFLVLRRYHSGWAHTEAAPEEDFVNHCDFGRGCGLRGLG